MKAYSYVAYTAEGQRRSGSIVAESEAHVAEQLAAMALFPSEIGVGAEATVPGLRRTRGTRLDPDRRAVFTRQMAVMLASDLTVEAALDVVLGSVPGDRLQGFVTRVKAAVLDGRTLSAALDRAGGGFEQHYIAAVRAGETSGDLATIFEQLAHYLESRGANKTQLISALIYPIVVAVVALIVCGFLVTVVAPDIVSMFEDQGQPLPFLTRMVLGAADWLARVWPVLLVALACAGLGFAAALRRPAVRDRWDRMLLRLPVVGRFVRLSAAAQYLRTLALVLASRQTVLDATRSAADVLTVARFRTEADAVVTAVTAGESLSRALARLSPLPPVARQLVMSGEKSARLPAMVDRAAVLVESWLNEDRRRLAVILDPLLMMLVGGLVLVIVLAIMLPIFDLQANIL